MLVCIFTRVCVCVQDKEQGKSIVVVGSWSLEEHLDWAQRNVARSYQLKDNGQQKVKYDSFLSPISSISSPPLPLLSLSLPLLPYIEFFQSTSI